MLQQAGYQVVAKCRTGNKEDGCAIFYNREKFSLEFSQEVEYNVGEAGLLDKDNIAVIAGLKSVVSGGQFLVATTHLLFRSVLIMKLLSPLYFYFSLQSEATRGQTGSDCPPAGGGRPPGLERQGRRSPPSHHHRRLQQSA